MGAALIFIVTGYSLIGLLTGLLVLNRTEAIQNDDADDHPEQIREGIREAQKTPRFFIIRAIIGWPMVYYRALYYCFFLWKKYEDNDE